jgi:hypothetical protein
MWRAGMPLLCYLIRHAPGSQPVEHHALTWGCCSTTLRCFYSLGPVLLHAFICQKKVMHHQRTCHFHVLSIAVHLWRRLFPATYFALLQIPGGGAAGRRLNQASPMLSINLRTQTTSATWLPGIGGSMYRSQNVAPYLPFGGYGYAGFGGGWGYGGYSGYPGFSNSGPFGGLAGFGGLGGRDFPGYSAFRGYGSPSSGGLPAFGGFGSYGGYGGYGIGLGYLYGLGSLDNGLAALLLLNGGLSAPTFNQPASFVNAGVQECSRDCI